jgi:hypothetical protein
MRVKADCRCQFCLDPIPIIVKAGVRSRLRHDDAGECKFCREIRGDMEPESFMRVILAPGKIAPDYFWLVWARRLSNSREIAKQMPQAAE